MPFHKLFLFFFCFVLFFLFFFCFFFVFFVFFLFFFCFFFFFAFSVPFQVLFLFLSFSCFQKKKAMKSITLLLLIIGVVGVCLGNFTCKQYDDIVDPSIQTLDYRAYEGILIIIIIIITIKI